VKVGGEGPALPTWSFPPRRLNPGGEPSGLVERLCEQPYARDDREPLVLRAVEVDGSITIVPVPADRDLEPEQLMQLARERMEDRQANQPAKGAEQRSEAPADAERPEAGACPPTRKPPRRPPTGGEGATDKAERRRSR
jgi:hypothetical protein